MTSRWNVLGVVLVVGLLGTSYEARGQMTAVKEALDLDNDPITRDLETSEVFKYRLTWQCSFANNPPPGGCGDFQVTDPLPVGLTFVTCAQPSGFDCNEAAGTVTIEHTSGSETLEDGDSAEAFVFVRVDSNAGGTTVDNVATFDAETNDEVSNVELDVAAPEERWSIEKNLIVPSGALDPAIDNVAVYEILLCPFDPANPSPGGEGSGNIVLDNVEVLDTCESGANIVSTVPAADLEDEGPPCQIRWDLGTLDPADFIDDSNPDNVKVSCESLLVTLEYPSTDFVISDTVDNDVVASADNPAGAGRIDIGVGNENHGFDAETPDTNQDKRSSQTQLGIDGRDFYRLQIDTNDGNVAFVPFVIEDADIPNHSPNDFISLLSLRSGQWLPRTPPVLANIEYTTDGSTWMLVPGATGLDGSSDTTFAIPAGAIGFRWVFPDGVPPGFDTGRRLNASGQPQNGQHPRIEFRVDGTDADVGDVFTNCVEVFDANPTVTPIASDCRNITIVGPTADINALKVLPENGNRPNDLISMRLGIQQQSTSTAGLQDPTIFDCLPPELQLVSFDGMDWDDGINPPGGGAPEGVDPYIETQPGGAGNPCVAGETMLRITWGAAPSTGEDLAGNPYDGTDPANPFTIPHLTGGGTPGRFVEIYADFTVRVAPGTLPSSPDYSNDVIVLGDSTIIDCRSGSAALADTDDVDTDSDVGETTCRKTEDFEVIEAAAIEADKFIGGFPGLDNLSEATAMPDPSCPDDGAGRTRAPCVAQGVRGQPFDYRIRLRNVGNVGLENYVVYDVFPHVGDTGITQGQIGSMRDSSWSPVLNGPLTISPNAPIQAELDAATIEYSSSTNPCRPEMKTANDITNTSNFPTPCDDIWTADPVAAFPNGFGDVKAFRILVPFTTVKWPVLNEIEVLLSMNIPLDSPTSDLGMVDLEIAWNNLGHRATNSGTGTRLLAAEPRKVGILTADENPFALMTTGVRIGNLVWEDANHNGAADTGEPGIYDVAVQLWDDTDMSGGPSAADTLFDSTRTDPFGKYVFDDADPAMRDNLGIPAGNYYVVIPADQGGGTALDGFFPSTNNEQPTANNDTDNDDNGTTDVSTPIVATNGTIEGLASGVVNVTIGAEPTSEVLRSGSGTDDDDDFFPDADSNFSVDFGYYELRLGNLVWLDIGAGSNEGNGVADSDEFGITGVSVELWPDLDMDGVFEPAGDDGATPIQTDTTNASGNYLFTSLAEGLYFVAIPDGQSGQSSNGGGLNLGDFGSSFPTSSDPSTADNDDDGTPAAGYASVSTQITLNGMSPTSESDSTSDGSADAEAAANAEQGRTLADVSSNLRVDFGFVAPVNLGNFVWLDDDRDGMQDPGEPGVENAIVELFAADGSTPVVDINGNTVMSQTTGTDGLYNFTDLPPGTYVVQVTPPSGLDPTTAAATPDPDSNPGDEDSNGSVNIGAGVVQSPPVTLTTDDEPDTGADGDGTDGNLTVDFGFVGMNLGNYVWFDTNRDGLQNDGAAGLAGATVELFTGDGVTPANDLLGNPVPSQTTGADGLYNFGNLLPGDYVVQVTPPAGYFPTVLQADPDPDTDDDTDSNGSVDVGGGAIQSLPVTLVSQSEPDAGVDTDGTNGNFTVDFGFVNPGVIGNYVWVDENNDGMQDEGEPGIPNVIVELLDGLGNVIDRQATDSHGGYLFTELPGGDYQVRVDESTLPPGMTQTTNPVNENGDFGNQSQAYPITLPPGGENLTADFGYNYNPNGDVDGGSGLAALGDRVWIDSDGDGVQDPDEIGVEGAQLTLTGAGADGVFGTADDPAPTMRTTDDNGYYLFDGLAPGAYQVEVTSSTGSHDVLNAAQYAQTGDPDEFASPATAPDHFSTTAVVLGPGDVFLNVDFGYQPSDAAPLGSIGDTVWLDIDTDGSGQSRTSPDGIGPVVQGDGAGSADPLESGFAGVTVALVRDANGDGIYDLGDDPIVATDTTDENGQYLFEDLPVDDGVGSDDYIVIVTDTANVLHGLFQTYDADGAVLTPNSSIVPDLTETPVRDQDFGYSTIPPTAGPFGAIGDTVWFDANRSGGDEMSKISDGEAGIEGVLLELLDGGGNVIATEVTDENGKYLFNGLPLDDGMGAPGADYRVRVAASNFNPGGVLEGTEATYDPAAPLNDEGGIVTLTVGTPVDLDQDFSYAGIDGSSGRIGNLVWLDANADGDFDGEDGPDSSPNTDDDEPVLEGVTVDLYRDLNGNGVVDPGEPLFAATTTGSLDAGTFGPNGNYHFDNLPFGDYVVDVSDRDGILNGYWHSLGAPATNDNSQADPYAVSISSGTPEDLTADFGYYVEPASVGNFVWLDDRFDPSTDRNGIQDPGEERLEGATVTLVITYPNSDTVTLVTVTDAQGHYHFDNLLIDEDYNGDGSGPEPTFEISVIPPRPLVKTQVGVGSGTTPDQNDSEDPDGAPAQPIQGLTDVAQQADPNSEQAIASYDFGFIELIDLEVVKEMVPDFAYVGDTVTFIITVSNAPDLAAATNVTIRDIVPSIRVSYVDGTIAGGTTRDDGDPTGAGLMWMIDVVPSGSSVQLSYQITLDEPGFTVNNVEVTEVDQVDRDSMPDNGMPDPADPSGGEDDEGGVPIVPRVPSPAPAVGPWGFLLAIGGLLAVARRRFRRL